MTLLARDLGIEDDNLSTRVRVGVFFPMLKIEILYYGRLDEYEYVRTCEEVVD
jgi:hypothetical protein